LPVMPRSGQRHEAQCHRCDVARHVPLCQPG
jgi:hypothetical protein